MLITIVLSYFYLWGYLLPHLATTQRLLTPILSRPETANRTLAEIDELYAARIPKRKWKGFQTTGATALDNGLEMS